MGNEVYEELISVSGHVYYGLFSIGEDGFWIRKMAGILKLFGRHKSFEEKFPQSEIIHVPRTENLQADSLARSAREQLSFVVHMDAKLPVWFAESVWVCLNWWQNIYIYIWPLRQENTHLKTIYNHYGPYLKIVAFVIVIIWNYYQILYSILCTIKR